MSSHHLAPAFTRDTRRPVPYGKTYMAYYVVYELAGVTYGEVVKPQDDQSVKVLMEQLGVGPNDWVAEPLG